MTYGTLVDYILVGAFIVKTKLITVFKGVFYSAAFIRTPSAQSVVT